TNKPVYGPAATGDGVFSKKPSAPEVEETGGNGKSDSSEAQPGEQPGGNAGPGRNGEPAASPTAASRGQSSQTKTEHPTQSQNQRGDVFATPGANTQQPANVYSQPQGQPVHHGQPGGYSQPGNYGPPANYGQPGGYGQPP